MYGSRLRALAALAVAVIVAAASARVTASSLPLLPSFSQIQRGPAGGSVWQGRIPNAAAPNAWRPSLVYLPPHFSTSRRYPVVYLLQGVPGSPYQYVDGLALARRADELIAAGELPPFIAVIPPAGLTPRFVGEWTGVWEDYLVRDVVPWVDHHLPVSASAEGRVVGGLSAGGYGAVDIGLRHPRLFGTLESWSGYYMAPRDGALAHSAAAELAAHDPSLLARREAPLLRGLGTRFFLSAGTKDDRASERATRSFARELSSLGIAHRVWFGPGGHDGRLWRAQLPSALRYALLGRVGSTVR